MAPYPFTSPAPVLDRVPGELPRAWRREALLQGMGADQRDIDAAEARKFKAITEWADLHRTDVIESHAGEGLLTGHDEHTMPILMSGVPVDEFCLAELSSALGISQGAARAVTEEGLEVRERLPRLWAKTMDAVLQVWLAREVARQTRSLSDEAADFVDRQLAPFARTLTTTRIKNLVAAAIIKFDPDRAAAEEAAAADNRGIWFDFEHGGADYACDGSRPGGTSRMEAIADTPDLLALRDALQQKVREQVMLGATEPDNVLMTKGLGILADPQHALDYSATAEAVLAEEAVGDPDQAVPCRRPSRSRPVFGGDRPIHVHLHTSTEVARVQTSGLPHTASPISRAAVERWISELAPGVQVKVTPVVDLNGNHAVDQYEIPDFIRSLAEERDGACVFPFCTNRGRFDLDHITEYVAMDDGGPPGQTGNRNLGKLCRYHHRAETHTFWTYKRVESVFDLDPAWPDPWIPEHAIEPGRDPDTGGPSTAYVWTSPLGLHYLVTSTGTYPLG